MTVMQPEEVENGYGGGLGWLVLQRPITILVQYKGHDEPVRETLPVGTRLQPFAADKKAKPGRPRYKVRFWAVYGGMILKLGEGTFKHVDRD